MKTALPPMLPPGAMRDWFWPAAMATFLLIALSTLAKNGTWNDEWIKQYEFAAPRADYPYSSRDGHPLHFIIGRFFGSIIGVTPFALRFPWALFAAACVPLSYLLGRLAGGERLARTLCLLTASSSYLLFYAQDANYYAEMLFYTFASAIAFWIFLDTGRVVAALAGIVLLGLMYLIHPFGAVCGGALILGTAIGAIGSAPARAGLRRIFDFRNSPVTAVIGVVGILTLVVLALREHVFASVLSQGRQFLGQFHLGGSYTNTAFNLNFIQSALRDFGPNLVSKSLLATILAWVYLPIALYGAAALGRQKSWQAIMIAPVFAATAFVVFCFKIDRFFHLRYVSYVVPFYLLAVAAGLVKLGGLVERKFPQWKLAWEIPTLVLLVLLAPGYVAQLTFDGAYLNKVERYLRERWMPEDRLFTYEMVPYTPMSPAGVPPEQHITMPGLPRIGQGWLDNAFFKYELVDHPAAWLLHHWNDPKTINVPLLEWADQFMTRVVYAPSIFENSSIQIYNQPAEIQPLPVVCAVLHRWDWPDRYIVAPRRFELDLASEEKRPRWDLKQERGLVDRKLEEGGMRLVWKSPFLFEHPGNYLFEITPWGDGLLDIGFKLNGKMLNLENRESLDGRTLAPARLPSPFRQKIEAMGNELEIDVMADKPGTLESLSPRLRIEPDFQTGFTINPLYFNPPDPQSQYLVAEVGRYRDARLIFKRNLPVTYRIPIADGGLYRVEPDVAGRKSGSVLFDLVLDGKPMGLLGYATADVPWVDHHAMLDLTAGLHDLTLTFLSETDVMAQNPDNYLNLLGITIAGAQSGDHDGRINLAGKLVSAGSVQPNFSSFAAPGEFAPGWNHAGEAKLTVTPDRAEPGEIVAPDPNGKILSFEIGRSMKTEQLATPLLPVTPGQYLYFDLDARTDVEGKHSANLRVEYLDSAGGRVGGVFARATDINQPTDWRRYAYFGAVPAGAASASIGIVIYPNSRTIAPPATHFDFRRFRIIDSLPAPTLK